MQEAVLTFRQMLGGWPGYEKGTATTCYLILGPFEKSLCATPPHRWLLRGIFVKHNIRTRCLMRMLCCGARGLLGAFYDVGETPVLSFGKWTGLG